MKIPQEKIQLSKYIANSGYCSRREADKLIKKGLVFLNKEIAIAGDKVGPSDVVNIKNKKIEPPKNLKYFLLNKPKGYVCTHKKFKNEKNVFELIKEKEKLFISGRLDKDSHGLILLTNNGDLINKLSHPKYLCEKIYLVKTKNHIKEFKKIKNSFLKGMYIENKKAQAENIEEIKKNYYKIILTQGINRQIRKMFKYLDIEIIDLQRISIKNIELKNLPLGKYRELNKKEIEELLKK